MVLSYHISFNVGEKTVPLPLDLLSYHYQIYNKVVEYTENKMQ